MINFVNNFLEVLFPYICPFCKNPLKYKNYNCNLCKEKLKFVPNNYNVKNNLKYAEFLDFVYSPIYYCEYSKKAIIKFKHYNNKDRMYFQDARVFSDLILRNYIFLKDINVNFNSVTNVPSFSNSNCHAAILAKTISKVLKVPYFPFLNKIKNNVCQHNLNFSQRKENIKDVFSFNLNYNVIKSNILIIDDVITSGSTLNECSRLLKLNGCKKVSAFTIACTKNKHL